jgi:hypothetical protein
LGVYVWSGSVVGALALLVLMVVTLGRGPLRGMIGEHTLHDLGKLLFGFAVFWAYIAFSQYFLMWYANIPEETIWYLKRWDGGWRNLSIAIPVVYFGIPFVVLMSAVPKRHPVVMTVVSALLLVIHYMDMYWMVMPELHEGGPAWQWLWLDVSAVLLPAGAAGLVIIRAMTRHPAYPIRDPRLHEALSERASVRGRPTAARADRWSVRAVVPAAAFRLACPSERRPVSELRGLEAAPWSGARRSLGRAVPGRAVPGRAQPGPGV